MSNKETGKEQESKTKRVNASLVYKLNSRLLLRLLSIFIVLNFVVFFATGIQTVIHAERGLTSVVTAIKQSDGSDPEAFLWLAPAGFHIDQHHREPEGFRFPGNTDKNLFNMELEGARSLRLPEKNGDSFFLRLNGLLYRYEFSQGPVTYSVSMEMGDEVLQIKRLMAVLFIAELILLLTSIYPVARLIRTTLRPISVLTEAAQNLNRNTSAPSPQKMENLADTLDSINAAKLDTRIPVEETEAELKNLAEAINSLLDRINETYQSQIRFVSDASHELRTPISVIEGYANLLDRWGKKDEKTLEEGITAIKDEASNMKDLVEQLLFLARGDNNTMSLQLEEFDLAQLADEALREFRMIDGGHEYESHTENVSVYADKGLIKQALRILMDNAIKYTNTGGKITLTVSGNEKEALVTVQDEGIGIPPDAVPQIFNRFYRTDQSRARATGGSGLGLSIAKWIVERHGGRLEVLSRQGIGTRVSIAIPSTPVVLLYRDNENNSADLNS
ncbi:MAG: HAMP domain-containing protein [Clostridiales bacterium]|nr:HAMP domain-containing protein [Clostridiales bacterium]